MHCKQRHCRVHFIHAFIRLLLLKLVALICLLCSLCLCCLAVRALLYLLYSLLALLRLPCLLWSAPTRPDHAFAHNHGDCNGHAAGDDDNDCSDAAADGHRVSICFSCSALALLALLCLLSTMLLHIITVSAMAIYFSSFYSSLQLNSTQVATPHFAA